MKTKIKFSDIAGMLERDEMREIFGGCGNACGSSGYSASNDWAAVSNNNYGYGGHYALSSIGSGFSATLGLVWVPNSSPDNRTKTGGNGSNSSSSGNSANNSGWTYDKNGNMTTNDPTAISRFYDYLMTNVGADKTQVNTFIANESTSAGQASNNILLSGTVLNEVVVNNNYRGPSKIPKGIVIDNSVNGNGTSNGFDFIGTGGSTWSSNTLDEQQRREQMDCVFQCLGWISLMRGDTFQDSKFYEKMYDFYNGKFNLYNYLTDSGKGVPLNQIYEFASNFFKVTDFKNNSANDLAKYIDPKNDPFANNQLIGIFRNPQGRLHAVNITSISGSELKYFDPQNSSHGSIQMVEMVGVFGISNRN